MGGIKWDVAFDDDEEEDGGDDDDTIAMVSKKPKCYWQECHPDLCPAWMHTPHMIQGHQGWADSAYMAQSGFTCS